MNNFANLAWGRRSIRKFTDQDIPIPVIEELIRIATSAPSGCNSQCWRFVAVKDRAVLQQMAGAVWETIEGFLAPKIKDLSDDYLTAKRKTATFFLKAPVAIAVFMTGLEFSDQTFEEILGEQGYDHHDLLRFLSYPDLLTIGAAVQNLLLAVHEKGYGACWMSEPAIAGEKINKILGIPPQDRFVSLIPIGVPAYTPREKKMKELGEIFTVV